MSTLNTKERKALPDSAFALPNRQYPIYDKPHAKAAIARAKEGFEKHWITKAEYDIIVSKANKVLGKD